MDSLNDAGRRAATIGSLAYLLSFAAQPAVYFSILEPLMGHATSTEIARNILAHETLFRVGIAGLVLSSVGIMIVSAAFYVILESLDRTLALVAMLSRLVYGLTWLLLSLNSLRALRLLTQPDNGAFPADQLALLAKLHLSGQDSYYVGLLFWSLAATVGSVLWCRSHIIPRALAVFGVIAGVWCAVCTLVFYIAPGFSDVVNLWLFDTPMLFFELTVCVILLYRSLFISSSVAARSGTGR
jgi:hypothetical protein